MLKNYSVDVTNDNKKLVDCPNNKDSYGQYTGNHGTAVAGILMAQGNNSEGIAGVASIASEAGFGNPFKLMAIKCDDTVDEDRHINEAYLYKAINFAVDKGADVINISYSEVKSEFSDLSLLQSAVENAIENYVTVVCAAGNDSSTTVRYPAGFDGVIGVGATYKNGQLASYSNRSSAVDIVAPGGYENDEGGYKIRVTKPNGYKLGCGTSLATPHVAATVAMMKSINAGLTPAQYLKRLKHRGNTSTKHDFIELDAGEAVRLMAEN